MRPRIAEPSLKEFRLAADFRRMDFASGSLERKMQRRFAPFAAVALLALVTTALPPRPSSWTLVFIASGLTLAIAASAVLVQWSRMPRWTYVVPPLAYFGVVALLGAATGGSVSGYAPLALLPVVWVALNLGRKEVALAGAAGCSLFIVPLVAGGAHYGAGEVRRAILWIAVASVVGFSLESLMRDKRRQAREARKQTSLVAEQEQTMATIRGVAQELTLSTDTRSLICEAALELSGGNLAAILEPDGDGNLVVTAWAGADPGRYRFRVGSEPSGSAVAFAAGKPFFVPDARDNPALPQDVVREVGMVSAFFEPIFRNGAAVGVLAVSWPERLEDLTTRATRTVALLAAEAASAIERADLLTHAQALAETDELTGLPNRRSWDAKIRAAVADAALGRGSLCVGLVDIDRFKAFNDRHGHQAGDRLLKTAGSAWRGALRQGDVLARYGGDEFAVALPHCSLEEAESVLERLRKLTPPGLTCSIGVAQWGAGESEFDVVARADEALYGAKDAGRDAVVAAS
jgi:diguanylate cyclase (GGDEF)-like protein